MTKKDLSGYKRKYQAFRHHAWAGLGFLSVVLAVRLVLSENSPDILVPIIFVLVIYIIVALLFTYRYRAGLSVKQEVIHPSEELEKEKICAEVEKERLKVEKKKAKAESKKAKKTKK